MIDNLAQFFSEEKRIYLNEVQYHVIEDGEDAEEYELICSDNLEVSLEEDKGVQILLTRTLKINPRDLFELSVSFGAELIFSENKDQINWKAINLAEEFRNNGDFITNNLTSRISLLVSQITSSYGQAPLVTPPGFGKNE